MVRAAIQLYTLRHLSDDLVDIAERVAQTEFQGIECYDAHFDELADRSVRDAVTTALSERGLDVVAAHVSIERLETDCEHVIAICDALGCSSLVIPTYDSEAFHTSEGIEAAADRIAGLGAILGDHDIELFYHNHTFEFDEVNGTTAFEVFVDRADDRFGFEPDVGLARHAGYDPISLLDLVADRAPLVHLTQTVPDHPERLHADPTSGAVDIEACATRAVENGAEWVICENGVTDDPEATLMRGSEVFAGLQRTLTT